MNHNIAEESKSSNNNIAVNVYDECEVHENVTVDIWKNSKTGEMSIGWYENE